MSIRWAEICIKKNVKFFVMYGQTEATARISYLPSEYALEKAGSIGIAIPGGSLWIEDEDGEVVEKSDTPGELVYKGDNVSLGYSNSWEDLRKGDQNRGILHTGDIAKRDREGFFYLVGRKNRFIKMHGHRVNLDEVDQLIKDYNCSGICTGTDDNLTVYVTKVSDKDDLRQHIYERTRISKTRIRMVHIVPHPSGKFAI
jgi:acyl-CoA synthetase (AMP-forming)/AMP-acid ligase II